MNIAVILAGGNGVRMGTVDKPKQFIEVYGKPLFIYTLETLEASEYIDKIIIACHKDWKEDVEIWIRKYDITKVRFIVEGGATRQESSYRALKKLGEICTSDDVVVIHDAARPLVSGRILEDNVKGALEYGAVDTVICASDTIVKSKEGISIDSIPVRKELYMGQTPQSFRYGIIMEAHNYANKHAIEDCTDDCQLVLNLNQKVHLVQGDKLNFKITTFEDLMLFKAILKMGKLEVN